MRGGRQRHTQHNPCGEKVQINTTRYSHQQKVTESVIHYTVLPQRQTSELSCIMAAAYPEKPTQDHTLTISRAPFRQQRIDHLSEILQALTDSAHDVLAENALYKDIETLSKATLKIDKAFYDIGQKLSQATKEQTKRVELYQICYDLETRWKHHHETYKQLLWRSREVAGKAQFTVDGTACG
ncbi:hypothetical protein PAXRUDRAFT_435102 [Paxillus rubicundulus Ve08.2h10]|uniref:Uncharacterized protein n=1 Tax=Paxillus rubicundulus Ve08.2h10 TaxID=930991 RepID=A0A0D0E2A6_9AGAM|nr:hypothetical protein PAXRUDRAFT_435102 [Paxillus rubicundulus Ve08.2h10]